MDNIVNNAFSTDWAKKLSFYREIPRYYDEGAELWNMIRNIDNGAFDVNDGDYGLQNYRSSSGMCVIQKKDLPWDYIYECIKLSRKDFIIFLPIGISDQFFGYMNYSMASSHYFFYGKYGKKICQAYAWYDSQTEGIFVCQLTGISKDEENTYPAYDGFGRYDTLYKIVNGIVGKDGQWLKEPFVVWK